MKRLVIFFGMTASGKSTLGQAWSRRRLAPYWNTDRVRKELAGLKATDRRPDGVGQGIYTAAMTARTYQTMLEHAHGAFSQGADMVVLDGSYSLRADRDQVRRWAVTAGAACLFVFCTCSEAEVRRRLGLRALDPHSVSDGRWEIYRHQQRTFESIGAGEEGDCLILETERPVPVLCETLAAHPFFTGTVPAAD